MSPGSANRIREEAYLTAQLGETVWIPTDVGAGAFPGEKLVTLDTVESIIQRSGGKYYLPAEVKAVAHDT
jgi:hypothetical protein